MRPRDLAVPFPSVDLDDDALTAARLMADRKLPGLVVCHGDGSPHTIGVRDAVWARRATRGRFGRG